MNQPTSSFAELGLSAPILSTLSDVGYETPSPIQAACIPVLLGGHDLLGEAQTGTGKTAAFALPTLERLDLGQRNPQVLVLTPTRELAIQVAEAYCRYARGLNGFQVLPIYGGQSIIVQLRQLSRGAHVIVGTPGRILDHIERGSLVLDDLRSLVLDEADEMLRMGFIDDVEDILEQTPSSRQTALFSATMPEAIRFVAHQYMRDPQEVRIEAPTATVSSIRQRFWQVRGVDKLDALTRILEVEDDFDAAIVFVRTKVATEELADKLAARGYAAAALHGDMAQGLRERVVEQLKSGALDIIVATDVAARGIDVARVSHVINYDIPYDVEAYIHRIGRTGRAGRQGSAILFVAPREIRMLRAIERATRQSMESLNLPSREAVADRRVAQFKEQVIEVAESEDLTFFREIVRELELEQDMAPSEMAAALAWMVQRERPLQAEDSELEAEPAPQRKGADKGPKSRNRKDGRDEILEKRRSFAGGALQRYRIEVGRNQGASPKEIVGAIANEGGIEGRHIGQIHLFSDYSTVELPANLPRDILETLQHTRVRQCPLHIRAYQEGELPDSGPKRSKRGPKPGKPQQQGGGKPQQQAPQKKAPQQQQQQPKEKRRRNKGGGEAGDGARNQAAEPVTVAEAPSVPPAAAPAAPAAPAVPAAPAAPAPVEAAAGEAPAKARKSSTPRRPRAPRKTAATTGEAG